MIDLRSFSSVWYWIAVAVMWSTASHWIIGIPFDMVGRAARKGGVAQQDLETMTRVMTNRLLGIANVSGQWILVLGSFLLTTLFLLGFQFRIQFAQALFLLFAPLAVVGLLNLRAARIIVARDAAGADLLKILTRQRVMVQVVGMIAIFVTAMWGMYQNLRGDVPPLFGALGVMESQVTDAEDNGRWRARGL